MTAPYVTVVYMTALYEYMTALYVEGEYSGWRQRRGWPSAAESASLSQHEYMAWTDEYMASQDEYMARIYGPKTSMSLGWGSTVDGGGEAAERGGERLPLVWKQLRH